MPNKIERLSDEAYFVFEPTAFNSCINAYDAVIANQTIVPGWTTTELEHVSRAVPLRSIRDPKPQLPSQE